MAAIPVADETDTRAVTGQPIPHYEPSDFIGPAFRQSNIVVSLAQRMKNSGAFAYDPNHNPLSVIKGTTYEQQHLDRFLDSHSEAETQSLMRQIDQEDADKRALAAAGGSGVIASMVAGVLDPTILMPGTVAVKAGRGGLSFSRAATEVGIAGALQAGVQEAALQASQETRPVSESLLNVGSATLLSAVIGGSVSRLLTPAERRVVELHLDRERAEMRAHANGEPVAPSPERDGILAQAERQRDLEAAQARAAREAAVPPEEPPAQGELALATPAPVGAAATETRKLEVVPTGIGVEKVGFDPMSRLVTSPSVSARRAAVDLAETPLRFKENLEGIPTTAGPALDRIAKMQIAQTRVAVSDELVDQWKQLRFGDAENAPWMARFRDTVGQITGNRPNGWTFDEFKKEVSLALTRGDQHEVPQVEAAAKFIRAKVFDPWKERAIKAGLLPEDVGVKTADSYLQRVYNKQAIAAKRPEFTNRIVDWLRTDQETKAGQKDRLTFLNAQLNSWDNHISKMEARFGRAEERAKILDARAAERSRDERQLTAGMNEEDPKGRVFDLQRRKVELEAEAKDLNEMIGFMRDMDGVAIPAILKRSAEALDRRLASARVEGARLSEAGRQANRSQKRLDAIEAQLEKTETRKDLIEETVALAEQFRNEVRAKIEAEIGAWEGKSAAEAKSAIKAREKAAAQMARGEEAPRLTSADSAVDRAVKRIIESDRDLSVGELRDRAQQIVERIMGSPEGRLPYDEHLGGPETGYHQRAPEPPRGPLAGRVFNMPDELLRPWLEQDIEHIVQTHLRTMVPDTLLTERFGDTRMTEAFRKIEDEFANLIDQTKSEAARTRLNKQREAALRDLAAVRDRVRGTYGLDVWNTMRGAARTAAAVKNLNVLESMGMATISSLPDMAGSVFRHGLGTVFRDAWAPFLGFMMRTDDAWKKAAAQFRAMGIATESMMATRAHALSDVMDSYRPQSRFERTLKWSADKYQIANLLAPWTDWGKVNASMVAGSEILRAAEAVVGGTATRRQIANLAEAGIDGSMAERIAKAFGDAGETQKGVRLPNTADWTDLAAREAFEGAVSREADIAIITPGQEKPLWLSNPIISVLGQFKSFTAASTQRMLIANLQRRDAQVLQGLLFSMGMGMVSYKVNSLLGGQPTSSRPADWIKESMSRGNLFGWLEEGNALASKMTRGGVDAYRLIGADKPLSRYAGRSVIDQMLGPTAGKIEALSQVTGAIGGRDWKESDTKALRKLMAAQNLFYLRSIFNQVEAGANNAFGIPMAPPKVTH